MSKDAKKGKPEGGIKLILKNKKAFHDYEILERLECGVVLVGTEVKSLRDGNANWAQSYVRVENGELRLIGFHIGHYRMGNIMNHKMEQVRTLLAHAREIRKLRVRVEEKGLTLIPLSLYWKNGRCKVEVGVGRGKAEYDKRDTLREKDMKRQIERDSRTR